MTADAKQGLAQSVRALFDDKAAAWTRGYAPGGALAARAHVFADAVAAVTPPPARALDFGCGTGHIGAALGERGYTVDACDMSEAMLAEGRRLFGGRVTFALLPADWRALPYGDGQFDAAVASSVLEYLPDVDAVLRELSRVLRAGGILAVTVPNMQHPRRWLEQALARALAIPGAPALAARIPRVANFARFLRTSRNRFSDGEWRGRFARAGFTVRTGGPGASPMLSLYVLERLAIRDPMAADV